MESIGDKKMHKSKMKKEIIQMLDKVPKDRLSYIWEIVESESTK